MIPSNSPISEVWRTIHHVVPVCRASHPVSGETLGALGSTVLCIHTYAYIGAGLASLPIGGRSVQQHDVVERE